jgi:hypothetical protein
VPDGQRDGNDSPIPLGRSSGDCGGRRRQEAGGRRQEAGGRRQEAGGRRQEGGKGRWVNFGELLGGLLCHYCRDAA